MNFLSESFLDGYKTKEVAWGFKSGPNSLGEITYRRTYSREGEVWWETVKRVVEGVYTIMYNHCEKNGIPFDEDTATYDAQQMYYLIFNFKFLPPGRGLWMMGNTDYIYAKGSAALNNCGFTSTKDIDKEFTKPFAFMMDMSMLGMGVGFDTLGAGKISWSVPDTEHIEFHDSWDIPNLNLIKNLVGLPILPRKIEIEDSREGWVDSLVSQLKYCFGLTDRRPEFDYSLVRPRGSKINGFGGVSEGPGPLMNLHRLIFELHEERKGEKITSRDITDIMNMIGMCVVAGNVRRTAQIALGLDEDEEFQNLKNYELNPERAEYGWTSNNSIFAEVGMDYGKYVKRIVDNGEPGFLWLENTRAYGRMAEVPNHKDWRVAGTNPCGEQPLENYEICCLVETFPHLHETSEDYNRTLKYAFIYAKAVTLIPTHWKETNAVMLRNRRIGTSMTGVAQKITRVGKKEFISWCSEGYKTVRKYDRIYSEWLCIRESIKVTSVKPSGTVSLLAGATPGAHYPTYRHYLRRIRFPEIHPDVQALTNAGYHVEPSVNEPNTVIVEFPVAGDDDIPTEREVSIGEKMALAVLLQKWWADNQVSATITFNPKTEPHMIPDLLSAYEDKLKSISFLPFPEESSYVQMPYEAITKERYEELSANLKPVIWESSTHDLADVFCDGATCELKL